ncbi:EIF4E2 [Symbiodinium sp. CCMP2456]|nr:EIF4E2 [Symbiodinium sp. CCMP2456]
MTAAGGSEPRAGEEPEDPWAEAAQRRGHDDDDPPVEGSNRSLRGRRTWRRSDPGETPVGAKAGHDAEGDGCHADDDEPPRDDADQPTGWWGDYYSGGWGRHDARGRGDVRSTWDNGWRWSRWNDGSWTRPSTVVEDPYEDQDQTDDPQATRWNDGGWWNRWNDGSWTTTPSTTTAASTGDPDQGHDLATTWRAPGWARLTSSATTRRNSGATGGENDHWAHGIEPDRSGPLDAGGPGDRRSGISEKMSVPVFAAEDVGEKLGSSARSYLRQIDAWSKLTRTPRDRQALLLYQSLQGRAWIEAEELQVTDLANEDGIEHFKAWVVERYQEVEIGKIGEALNGFFKRLRRGPQQSIREFNGLFDRSYARLLEIDFKLPETAKAWAYLNALGLTQAEELSILGSVANEYVTNKLQRAAVLHEKSLKKAWDRDRVKPWERDRGVKTNSVHNADRVDEENDDKDSYDESPFAQDDDGGSHVYEAYMTAKMQYKDTLKARGLDQDALRKATEDKIALAKSKSYCSVCKQRGHWHRDPQCPANVANAAKGRDGSKDAVQTAHAIFETSQAAGDRLYGITDCACTKSVMGTSWLQRLVDYMKQYNIEVPLLPEQVFYEKKLPPEIKNLLSSDVLSVDGFIRRKSFFSSDNWKTQQSLLRDNLQRCVILQSHVISVCGSAEQCSIVEHFAIPAFFLRPRRVMAQRPTWQLSRKELLSEATAMGLSPLPEWTNVELRSAITEMKEAKKLGLPYAANATRGVLMQNIRDYYATPPDTVMTIGRHKGNTYAQIPLSYGKWADEDEKVNGGNMHPDLRRYVMWYRRKMNDDFEEEPTTLEKMSNPEKYAVINPEDYASSAGSSDLSWAEVKSLADKKGKGYAKEVTKELQLPMPMTRTDANEGTTRMGLEILQEIKAEMMALEFADEVDYKYFDARGGDTKGHSHIGDFANKGINYYNDEKMNHIENPKAGKDTEDYLNMDAKECLSRVRPDYVEGTDPRNATEDPSAQCSGHLQSTVMGKNNYIEDYTNKGAKDYNNVEMDYVENPNLGKDAKDYPNADVKECLSREGPSHIESTDPDQVTENHTEDQALVSTDVHGTSEDDDLDSEAGDPDHVVILADPIEEFIRDRLLAEDFSQSTLTAILEAVFGPEGELFPSGGASSRAVAFGKEDDPSCRISLGYYVRGGFRGICNRTADYASLSIYLKHYIHQRCPEARWTSLCVSLDQKACIHTDRNKLKGTYNYVTCGGDYCGGGVWCEVMKPQERGGQERRDLEDEKGRSVSGVVLPTNKGEVATFYADRRHATEDWSGGHRWMVACFTSRAIVESTKSEKRRLRQWGFPVPDLRHLTPDRKMLRTFHDNKDADPPKFMPRYSARKGMWKTAIRASAFFTWSLASISAARAQLYNDCPKGPALFEIGGCRQTVEISEVEGIDFVEPLVWNDLHRENGVQRVHDTIGELRPGVLWLHPPANVIDYNPREENVQEHPRRVFHEILEECGRAHVQHQGTLVVEVSTEPEDRKEFVYQRLRGFGEVTEHFFGDTHFYKVRNANYHEAFVSANGDGPEPADDLLVGEPPERPMREGASGITFGKDVKADVATTLRRLHQNLGHPPNTDLTRHLRLAGASEEILKASRSLSCETCKRCSGPRSPKPASEPKLLEFNDVVAVDMFFAFDIEGKKQKLLSIIDCASSYHVVTKVPNQTGDTLEKVFLKHWIQVFGAPKVISLDLETGIQDAFSRLSDWFRIDLQTSAGQAHWQAGFAERHGKWWKEIFKKVVEEKSVTNDEVEIAVAATSSAKNTLRRRCGWAPCQIVFRKTPRDDEDIIEQEIDDGAWIARARTPDDAQHRRDAIRAASKAAFLKVRAEEKVRRGSLQRARVRGRDLANGEMALYWRKDKNNKKGAWRGPGVVVGRQQDNYWIARGGRCQLCAPEHVRPASPEELGGLFAMRATQADLQKLIENDHDDEDTYVREDEDADELIDIPWDEMSLDGGEDPGESLEFPNEDIDHDEAGGQRRRLEGDEGRDQPAVKRRVRSKMPQEAHMLKRATTRRGREKQLEKELPWGAIPVDKRPLFQEAEAKHGKNTYGWVLVLPRSMLRQASRSSRPRAPGCYPVALPTATKTLQSGVQIPRCHGNRNRDW